MSLGASMSLNNSLVSLNITYEKTTMQSALRNQYIHDPVRVFLLSYVSLILTVIGLLQNCVTFYIVGCKIGVNKVLNFFIISLTISDFGQLFFMSLTRSVQNITGKWIFGLTFCKITSVAMYYFYVISMLTHLAIAIERFRCVKNSKTTGLTIKQTRVFVVATWLYAFCFSTPLFFWSHVDQNSKRCVPQQSESHMYFILVNFSVNMFMPCLVILVLYLLLIKRMVNLRPSIPQTQANTRMFKYETYKKVTRTAFVLVLIFLITSVPFHLNLAVIIFFGTLPGPMKAFGFTWILILMGVCLNPILYALMWKTYQSELAKMFNRIQKAFSSKTAPEIQVIA